MSDILNRLAKTIEARKGQDPESSYVAKLFAQGPEKCAEKFGEEAIEAIIAAIKKDPKHLSDEAADVIFHLLVMLSAHDVKLETVLATLEAREGVSGITEKQNRKE